MGENKISNPALYWLQKGQVTKFTAGPGSPIIPVAPGPPGPPCNDKSRYRP